MDKQQQPEIIALTAMFDNGLRRQMVIILNVENGQVFVRPMRFCNMTDPAADYHGWITTAEYIRGVMAHYSNGTIVGMGDPPCAFHTPILTQVPETVRN